MRTLNSDEVDMAWWEDHVPPEIRSGGSCDAVELFAEWDSPSTTSSKILVQDEYAVQIYLSFWWFPYEAPRKSGFGATHTTALHCTVLYRADHVKLGWPAPPTSSRMLPRRLPTSSSPSPSPAPSIPSTIPSTIPTPTPSLSPFYFVLLSTPYYAYCRA